MVWSVEALLCPISESARVLPQRAVVDRAVRHYWEPRLRITVLIVSKMIKKSKDNDMCLM